jgi:ribosome-associated protein
MIRITDDIALDEREISFDFIRSSGPGGQNVNKVSSAVQLRFDVTHSPNLPEDVRRRLRRLAKNRINKDGVMVIEARRHRTQEKNRSDAQLRLIRLIRQAAVEPRKRKETAPSKQAKAARLAAKRRRSLIKRQRGAVRPDED